MSEVECPACGAKVPVPGKIDGDRVSIVCPDCGADIQCSIDSTSSEFGAETLFQPQLLSKELSDEPSDGAAIDDAQEDVSSQASAGTMVLESKDSSLTPPGPEPSVVLPLLADSPQRLRRGVL